MAWVWGRGTGKTLSAEALAFKMACDYPGITGKFLEPDWKRINQAFLPKWEAMVPREVYTINRAEQCIKIANGSRIFYQPRNITGNQAAAADAGRGPDVSFIVDDEAAIMASMEAYRNNLPSIREAGCPNLFYLLISTFAYGEFERIIGLPGMEVSHGKSEDNIYLPPGTVERWRAAMPPEVAAIELDSKPGTPQGQIWKHFKEAPFPRGNILEGYEFDTSKPWYLGVDMGNHSSWHILQTPRAIHPETGAPLKMGGSLLCMVEEWLPNNEGGFEEILGEVIRKYCNGNPRKNPPKCVYIGHDVNTKGQIKGTSAAQILGNLGWDYQFPAGPVAGKDLQRSHLQRMLWERRYVVAATKDSLGQWRTKQVYGEGKNRGILKMFKTDTYPKEKGLVFTKDKASSAPESSIEDCRDCTLMEAVLWRHPDTYDVGLFYK